MLPRTPERRDVSEREPILVGPFDDPSETNKPRHHTESEVPKNLAEMDIPPKNAEMETRLIHKSQLK